jgi:hypothetical protein
MKSISETTRMKVYHGEHEIKMLPEFVGMNWVYLKTRTVYQPKD